MPGIHLVRRRGSSMVPSEDRPQTAIPANARATRSWATLRASSMELLRQRQAQAGAVGFGREKWFKHSTHVFRGNARSRVLDSDAELPGFGPGRSADEIGGDAQFPVWRGRFDRVEKQVEEGLFQLIVVAPHQVGRGAE